MVLPDREDRILHERCVGWTHALFVSLVVSWYKSTSARGARMVRELFQMARQKKVCIVFFDEVDAIGGSRGGEGDGEVQRTMLQIVTSWTGSTLAEM